MSEQNIGAWEQGVNMGKAFAQMNALGAAATPFLFAIDYELKEAIIIPNPEQQSEVLYAVRGATNAMSLVGKGRASQCVTKGASMDSFPLSYQEYQRRFEVIRSALVRGDSFLANLTVATPVEPSLSFEEIFHHARAPYKLYVPGRFVCFSPECFITLDFERREIVTRPMKGTVDAAIPDAERKILEDYKERCEHYTIVDLLRSDLARVATDISVERFRYIDRVETTKGALLQVSSLIVGRIANDTKCHIGDIFRHMLPAGSICGAPKQATLEVIRKAEEEPRGFYTGVFGLFDGKHLDSAVLIRYLEEMPDGTIRYRSGGGITINSIPMEEYREVIDKVYLPFLG